MLSLTSGHPRDDPVRNATVSGRDRGGRGRAPGFVSHDRLDGSLREALCLLLPSSREGYGLVVVEASSKGTHPSSCAARTTAAVELVEDGVNGVIAENAEPAELARAIVRVHRGGRGLRESTCAWFAANARRVNVESALQQVAAAYAGWASARR